MVFISGKYSTDLLTLNTTSI